jgi:exopolysaccharide biosynthesis polyprenyl glycosylphosphotransferase
MALDVAAAAVAGAFAHGLGAGAPPATLASWLLPLTLIPLWVLSIAVAGGYQRRYLGIGPEEFNRVGIGVLALIASVGTISWLLNFEVARSYVAIALPVAAAMTLVARFALRKHIHRMRGQGRYGHRTVVVGEESRVADLLRLLGKRSYHGYQVVGVCTPSPSASQIELAGTPILGYVDDIVDHVRRTGADTVAVLPGAHLTGDVIRQISWDLAPTGASVVVAPAVVDVVGPRMAVRPVEGLPLLHLEQPAFTGIKRTIKRVYDPIVAACALVVLLPVVAAVATAIKLDSRGPVFFRQTRVGEMGREFKIIKFRTMVVDAEGRKAELSHLNEGAGPLFKLRADPRVTRVGRVLRKTSLDELPQLVNVLLGQMSIVGPRPHLPSEVEEFGSDFQRRLLVKPGLTGLWQVSGRSDLSFEESVLVDLRYVENWSLGMDAFIIWKTAAVMVRGHGAY